MSATTDTPVPRPSLWPLMLLSLTALFVFFFRLGERGFENKDTVWYVEIAWEMLRSGDWLVPRFNTVIFTEKPVLFIWCVAAFSKLAGAVTPFTARLPSALAAFGTTLLTAALGSRLLGRRAGIMAGFILCTAYAFAWEARTCMVDPLFTFLLTLALYSWYRGIAGDRCRAGWCLAAYIGVGLAALTKGPLGVVLPALVGFCYLIWSRKLGFILRTHIPLGLLIILAIQAAWYVPFLIRIGPDGRSFFYDMYIYKENLLRFTTGFDHCEPFWFYIPAILSRFLPWSPFLVLYPFIRRRESGNAPGDDRAFPCIWFLSILAFLTLSTGKHSRYALPLYPAAAILVAGFWGDLRRREGEPLARIVSLTIAGIAATGAIALPIGMRLAAPHLFLPSLAASALVLALAIPIIARRGMEPTLLAFATVVCAFACAWGFFVATLPAHEERRAEHRRLAESLLPAIHIDQLATYGLFSRRLALGFFIGRPVIYIDREKKLLDYLTPGRRGFCLMEGIEYDRLKNALPPTVVSAGRYRYRHNELVLIKNR